MHFNRSCMSDFTPKEFCRGILELCKIWIVAARDFCPGLVTNDVFPGRQVSFEKSRGRVPRIVSQERIFDHLLCLVQDMVLFSSLRILQ